MKPDLNPADYFNRLAAATCPRCNGTGVVWEPMRIIMSPGMYIEREQVVCPVCGGTGKEIQS